VQLDKSRVEKEFTLKLTEMAMAQFPQRSPEIILTDQHIAGAELRVQ